MHHYSLGMADGVYGPGDVPRLTIAARRLIKGPGLPNWQSEFMLASLHTPFEWRGELVTYVTFGPRHASDTMTSITRRGGTVGVGRVRPGHDPLAWTHLVPSALDYWGVGTLTILDAEPR